MSEICGKNAATLIACFKINTQKVLKVFSFISYVKYTHTCVNIYQCMHKLIYKTKFYIFAYITGSGMEELKKKKKEHSPNHPHVCVFVSVYMNVYVYVHRHKHTDMRVVGRVFVCLCLCT